MAESLTGPIRVRPALAYDEQMRRRDLLAGAALPLLAQAPAKPNVLVILTDDQGYGDLGANGAPEVKTPNLDRLAREGARFTDWHSNSPVCSPSRASVLTGQYPQHCGVPEILFSKPTFDVPGLKTGERTLATELKRAGYRTGAIGKWHLGSASHSRPRAQGFDEFFGFYSGWIDYYSHRYYSLGGTPVFHDLWRNEQEIFEDTTYQTEMLAREARAFISKPSTQPFFLYLTFGAPHYPMMAPPQYLERFPATMDRDRRMHLAMIAAVDDAIGSITQTLDQRGLSNTLIFFQSDNGATREERADHRARPYRGGSNGSWRAYKGSLFEGGHRVPALMRWPDKIPAGRVVDAPCMAMDLMPTILSWVGAPAVPQLDGLALGDTIIKGQAPPSRTLYWDYAGQRAARRDHWKLIDQPNEGLGTPQLKEQWLVDLREDPSEQRNRISDAPEVAKQLQAELARWPYNAKQP